MDNHSASTSNAVGSGGRLAGKVAIITGSATGIGKACAIRMAREGASVTIDYVGSTDDASEVVEEIEKAGGKAIAVQADISQEDQVQHLVDETVQRFGRLDIMQNNAGWEQKHPFLEMPFDTYQKVIAINLTGTWLGSQIAARQMVKQGHGGRIINTSSVHEDVSMPTNAPYCAAKGGIRMLMRTIAVELAPHKITVNNIAPGAIFTPIDAEIEANPKLEAELMSEIPLRRWGKPEEVAALAVFLASDEASYITGATYFIDGGMSKQSGSL
ncbi:MAG TPA: SDR family oxidoreductase [Chloroflexota bacterium]|nr:SDR family oxidoreductase [Chloroflexota bacterium]